MQGQGVVFVTGDRLGDQVADLLEAEGCQVIRGPKPNPPALYRILRDGVIASAAIDVFEHESLAPESPLRALDSVIFTPHMAGRSRELMDGMPPAAAANTLRMLRGELQLYAKNPEVYEVWQQRLAQLP